MISMISVISMINLNDLSDLNDLNSQAPVHIVPAANRSINTLIY